MRNALIVGAGPGISGAFARALRQRGWQVALASRDLARLAPLADALGARAYACDVAEAVQVARLFEATDQDLGPLDLVLHNPSHRVRGPIAELDVAEVAAVLHATAMGAFHVAQQAAQRMAPRGQGALFFTGATASVKAYAQSAPFAMGKFAVRALAQSLARELGPQGVHVAHFVIDGAVVDRPDPRSFSAANIAQSLLATLDQPPGAWSWEVELRAFDERF
jgi:NAD(P)-dependent dehydrogenase (short-subunit alcohol dehydrogenase family)